MLGRGREVVIRHLSITLFHFEETARIFFVRRFPFVRHVQKRFGEKTLRQVEPKIQKLDVNRICGQMEGWILTSQRLVLIQIDLMPSRKDVVLFVHTVKFEIF